MLFTLPLGSGSVSARTWIVDPEGGGDFTLISEACTAAADGDTVGIQPGEYEECSGPDNCVYVQYKSLCLRGLAAEPNPVRLRTRLGFYCCPTVRVE